MAGYDVTDFEKDVIQKSHEIPVLVDFWADWCGPCRILGPVLERLAQKADGDWRLAKLDTEQFPDIAARYSIRGIPAVKLFVDGAVVGEFVGALPEYQVEHWLRQYLPGRFHKKINEATAYEAEGRTDEAAAIYETVLQESPDTLEARLGLARLILFTDPHRAGELVKNLEEPEHQQLIDAVRTVARLADVVRDPGKLPDGEMKSVYQKGAEALLAKRFAEALERFIEVIRRDRFYDDDGARRACIAIFKLLGEEDSVTQEYRRSFSSALYV